MSGVGQQLEYPVAGEGAIIVQTDTSSAVRLSYRVVLKEIWFVYELQKSLLHLWAKLYFSGPFL